MSFIEKFEQLQKNRYFLGSVALFHVFAGVYFFWQFNVRQAFTFHDVVVTFSVLVLVLYWKSFAKMKKRKFEKNP